MVEIDGEIHCHQTKYDVERDRVLTDLGLSILRIDAADVRTNLREVMLRITIAAQKSSR